MREISINSPAKINLYLRVKDKRDDGYHNIDTSFQCIDIYDYMNFKYIESGIKINSEESYLSDEDNTIYKSAKILQGFSKNASGVEISIKKNIPVGAGLGGGSSNAASTLVALNKLWELDLNINVLMEIGSSIGADVPFFVNGKNAIGDGIGDILKETSAITENLLVINPKIHNSTKEMFKLLEVWKGKNKFDSLNQQNHFWNVFIENNPKIEEFYNQIAEEYEINLSGSGSSMFIKYKDRDEIDNVIKKIPTNWRLFFCKPLQYSPICYIK